MNEVVVSVPPAGSFLSVGLSLKISLTIDEQKVTCGSTLLGWKDHAWLVCERPLQLGYDQQVPSGTPCIVSYHHDGKLVGYHSEIRDLTISPVPLMFIAYPKIVEEMHLRRHVRVSSNEPILVMRPGAGAASASTLSSSDYLGGLLQDLSEGGCSVALTQRPAWLRQGSTVHLEFELPGLGHITNLTGIVKSSDSKHTGDIVGIEFQFKKMEYIEYRGWGGSVRHAIEQCVSQKASTSFLIP